MTTGIREVREHGIVTADGVEHEADTIIFGTGFQVTDMPIGHKITGRDGATLHEVWQGSPNAHLGTTVAGFPNLFLLMGPNTGLGHTSVTIMIEAQAEYAVQAIRYLRHHPVATLEPTVAAQDAWRAEIDRRGRGTVWTAGGCDSWYLDGTGRNSTLWPTFVTTYQRRMERFEPAEHTFGPRRPAPARPVVAV